jgi:hypothetical protein
VSARVGDESRRTDVIHASSPRSASNIGRTLLISQHISGLLSNSRAPNSASCRSVVYSPTRSTTFNPSCSVSCCLKASVSANWNPVSRNRIGTSGLIRVAMWITTVPSVWNADAMAMCSRPLFSSAHARISLGCTCSRSTFKEAISSSERRVCIGTGASVGTGSLPRPRPAGAIGTAA